MLLLIETLLKIIKSLMINTPYTIILEIRITCSQPHRQYTSILHHRIVTITKTLVSHLRIDHDIGVTHPRKDQKGNDIVVGSHVLFIHPVKCVVCTEYTSNHKTTVSLQSNGDIKNRSGPRNFSLSSKKKCI